MGLPLFSLNSKPEDFGAIGELVSEGPHDTAKGAHDSKFRITEGQVILTVWRGKVHCVIYQTPLEDQKTIKISAYHQNFRSVTRVRARYDLPTDSTRTAHGVCLLQEKSSGAI
jgi:hypothetical protein